ncbi:hypothetical protein [Amycolatopsis thermoflava]|uniref:hypothetical protein n=1 Tax=Amycolatopsis thermoflava TaxID=84480 RepID=UPI0036531F5A
MEQVGILLIVDLLFEGLQFGGQLGALRLNLGATVLDVLDELLVWLFVIVAGDFESADQALLPGIEVGDRLLDRRDSLVAGLLSLHVQLTQS